MRRIIPEAYLRVFFLKNRARIPLFFSKEKKVDKLVLKAIIYG
ncbi:MAG: hypothetical protein ABH952_11005 [Candidatus Omnitrophota bacterium]